MAMCAWQWCDWTGKWLHHRGIPKSCLQEEHKMPPYARFVLEALCRLKRCTILSGGFDYKESCSARSWWGEASTLAEFGSLFVNKFLFMLAFPIPAFPIVHSLNPNEIISFTLCQVNPLTTDASCNFDRMLSVGTICFKDRFCASKKRWDRGRWVGFSMGCHAHGSCLGWL